MRGRLEEFPEQSLQAHRSRSPAAGSRAHVTDGGDHHDDSVAASDPAWECTGTPSHALCVCVCCEQFSGHTHADVG